jgi:hypothetical protein
MTTILLSLAALAWSEPLPPVQPSISAEHAACLYRISIYEAYRLNRDEYNARREVSDRLSQALERADVSPAQRQLAIQWFESARDSADAPVLPDFVDELPTLPVATSGREEAEDRPAPQGETSLDVKLPKGAVQTGSSPFFSRILKAAFRAVGVGGDETFVFEPVQPEAGASR